MYTGGLIIVFGRTSDLEETFWVLYFFFCKHPQRVRLKTNTKNYDDLSRLVYIFRRKRENMKQQSYVHQKFVTKVKICYCQVTSQLSAIRAALSGKISSSSTSLASQSVHNLDFRHLKKKIYVCPKHLWEISFIFSWHMFLTRESQSGGQMKVSEEVWVKTIQLWKSKEDIRNRILASRDLKIYQHENDISPNLQQNDILS